MVARTFRQATCAVCGSDLSRVNFPAIHLERCERAAARVAEMHQVPLSMVVGRPTLRARIRLWIQTTFGIASRGAAE